MTFKKGFTGNEALFSHKKLKTGIKVSTPSNFLILGYFCLIQAMNLSQLALSLNRTNGRKWARYYRAVGIYAVVVGTVVPTNHGRLVYPITIRGGRLCPPRFLTFGRPCITAGRKCALQIITIMTIAIFSFLSSGFFTVQGNLQKKST